MKTIAMILVLLAMSVSLSTAQASDHWTHHRHYLGHSGWARCYDGPRCGPYYYYGGPCYYEVPYYYCYPRPSVVIRLGR